MAVERRYLVVVVVVVKFVIGRDVVTKIQFLAPGTQAFNNVRGDLGLCTQELRPIDVILHAFLFSNSDHSRLHSSLRFSGDNGGVSIYGHVDKYWNHVKGPKD